MNKIVLTRSDLNSLKKNSSIQNITISNFLNHNFKLGAVFKADEVIFIDSDKISYKILKSRFGEYEGDIFIWVDVFCFQCNKTFKTYNTFKEGICMAACPNCDNVNRIISSYYIGGFVIK